MEWGLTVFTSFPGFQPECGAIRTVLSHLLLAHTSVISRRTLCLFPVKAFREQIDEAVTFFFNLTTVPSIFTSTLQEDLNTISCFNDHKHEFKNRVFLLLLPLSPPAEPQIAEFCFL